MLYSARVAEPEAPLRLSILLAPANIVIASPLKCALLLNKAGTIPSHDLQPVSRSNNILHIDRNLSSLSTDGTPFTASDFGFVAGRDGARTKP
jgi:hypothetical protein